MSNNVEEFSVGDVVIDEEGSRGFVRYVGPVATAKNKSTIWVGVEWASQGRGKHDGSVQDKTTGETIRYFSCAEGQGSFVKPQFLRTGKSFAEALLERYEPNEEEAQTENESSEGTEGPRRRNGESVAIEAVGMDQIRRKQRVEKLREVSLASCAVVSAGEPGWISDNCSGIRELDMSDNLIDSWSIVGTIARQLPELEHLSLARNQLKKGLPTNPIERLPESLRFRFETIRVLVLNKTGTTFSQMQRLDTEGVFPALEELVLGDNDLDSLDPLADIKSEKTAFKKGSYAAWAQEQIKAIDRSGFTPESFAKGFQNLRILDISRNNLSNWSEIWRLSRLPSLRQVNASENPIDTIFFDKPLQVPTTVPATPPVPQSLPDKHAQTLEGKDHQDTAEQEQDMKQGNKKNLPEDFDVIISNGFRVTVPEFRERARYTEARLFKGDGTGGGAQPFASLEVLLLCRTRLSTWESINALNDFPKLKELRIQGSPIVATAANPGAARQTIIGRVAGLCRLNGSDVSERERIDAERLYLKRIAMERASVAPEQQNATEDAFLLENPRYHELVQKHGDPMEAAKRAAADKDSSSSLASNSARITIRSFDPHSCTVPPVTKKLPLTMTVKEVKVLCHRLFKVDVELQSIFYRETGKNFGHPTPLDDDNFPIVDFGVKEGGEIIMEAKDAEKERKEKEKRDQQEAAKMKEQEQRAILESNIKRQEVEQGKSMMLQQ